MDVKKITRLGLLTAVALIMFVIEMQIPNPVPIPGIKLGLANIVTVYAAFRFRGRDVFIMVLTRLLLGAMLSGTIVSFLFSLCGSLLCLAGMLPLSRAVSERYIWLCSVAGAVLHNIGQMIAAVAVMQTFSVLVYLPPLLVSGCIAGAFTGICAQIVVNRVSKGSD